MNLSELKKNISLMIPQDHGESAAAYEFYLKEVFEIFGPRNDYQGIWDKIKEYDGRTKRPRFSFFKAIEYTNKSFMTGEFSYYKCSCGALLSESSNGACPICHSTTAERRFSKEAKKVIQCQSSCFDCPVYSEYAIGPECQDYGTPAFEDCKDRGHCKCAACCRFEYLRTYHPERLQAGIDGAVRGLPNPLSEAGRAFSEGRASFLDINGLLKWKGEKNVDTDI